MTTDHTPTECRCGHGADRHDAEAGGCIECRCTVAAPAAAALTDDATCACGGRNGEHWHRCPDRAKSATPASLPDERLAAIRARVDAATPGPGERGSVWLLRPEEAELFAHAREDVLALVDEVDRRPREEYPGELDHLRDLLREVCRLANDEKDKPEFGPLTELLIDHYSDPRMVDATLARRQAGGAR